MENEFFLNAGLAPLLHFDPSNAMMANWQPTTAATTTTTPELNSSPDCFYNPGWEKSTDQGMQFDSALSSMVNSPVASNSNVSNESFVIRELIGKLGNIGGGNNNNNNSSGGGGEISPHSQPFVGSASGSCYTTPLNSPPKMNRGLKVLPMASNVVPEFSADPGFAERAARFSCFGSRSFNGRTGQLCLNGSNELRGGSGSSPVLTGTGKLSRVSSSPSLKELGSHMGMIPENNRSHCANSQEESTISDHNPIAENGARIPNETNPRKRKAASSKGKAKESPASTKVGETNDNSSAKRAKPNEPNGNENSPAKTEEETKRNTNSGDEKQAKPSLKPPEPPKDYIHVRARRGQATDSHSLAERVRREKISERMKLLQDLVPGCNKVTGKALMLDEIINYVQSLQRQVEFLSMKLASVNTRLDGNIDTLMSKDVFQPNNSMPHPIFPLDSSAQAVIGHQPQQNQTLHSNVSNGPMTHCSIEPLDSSLCQNLSMHLPQLNGFSDIVSQYPAFGEDDLQKIVQMGFGQNPNQDASLQPQGIRGPNQVSHMKIEL